MSNTFFENRKQNKRDKKTAYKDVREIVEAIDRLEYRDGFPAELCAVYQHPFFSKKVHPNFSALKNLVAMINAASESLNQAVADNAGDETAAQKQKLLEKQQKLKENLKTSIDSIKADMEALITAQKNLETTKPTNSERTMAIPRTGFFGSIFNWFNKKSITQAQLKIADYKSACSLLYDKKSDFLNNKKQIIAQLQRQINATKVQVDRTVIKLALPEFTDCFNTQAQKLEIAFKEIEKLSVAELHSESTPARNVPARLSPDENNDTQFKLEL